mgnify:CR=1 FL=1
MIKNLVHDPIFLAGKSEAATKEDLQIAQDLIDNVDHAQRQLRWYGGKYDRCQETYHRFS